MDQITRCNRDVAHPQIASDAKKFFASNAKTHSRDLKSQENSVVLGIRWAGAVRPSWSHLGQVGVFQVLGTTRNKKLHGRTRQGVEMIWEPEAKIHGSRKTRSGSECCGGDFVQGQWQVKTL